MKNDNTQIQKPPSDLPGLLIIGAIVAGGRMTDAWRYFSEKLEGRTMMDHALDKEKRHRPVRSAGAGSGGPAMRTGTPQGPGVASVRRQVEQGGSVGPGISRNVGAKLRSRYMC